MRSILITGVAGVGKSTLSRLTAEWLGVKNWDYADLMLRVATDIRHKDDLHSLSFDRRNGIYRQVEVLLAELFEPGDGSNEPVLLENHLSIIEGGRIRTFPHEDCRRYNPAALAVVEADSPVILRRRQRDGTRERHIGSIEEIALQQGCNRDEGAMIAARLGIPFGIITNENLESSVAQLAAWIGEVLA